MGTINLYDSIDGTHQIINGCGKLSEILPSRYLNKNTIFLNAGHKINSDYYVGTDDIIYVRKTPKATAVAIILLTGTIAMAGYVVGSAIKNYIDKKTKEAQEKAQRDAQNLAQQIQQLPFIKGANNRSALGYSVPFIMGDVYHTPYKMTDGFYTLEDGNKSKNEYGSKQYYNVLLNLGFGNQSIKNIMIGSDSLVKDENGISEGIHYFDEDSIFYNPAYPTENFIEVRKQGSNFIESHFQNKVILTNDGNEIKHDYGQDAEPLIRTLSDYTQIVEVCIQLNGLRRYNSDASRWESRKATIRAYWTNKENPSDSDWEEFYFDNMTNNSIELNTNKTIRFLARKEFTASQTYGKTLKIKLIKETPKLESNSNEECYLLYYQSYCYDNAKSSSSILVPCAPVEDELVNKTTRIAIRLKADDNTKDMLDEMHSIVCGKAKVWNGSTWSEEKVETRNPASWILEILTSDSHFHSKYNESEIDLESFGRLYEYCEENEYFTDGILTSGIKKRDLLTDILSNVNSTLILNSDGLLEIVIDTKETTPVALLNAENISSITYSKDLSRKPDGLKVTFTNRESWQIDTFYCYKDSLHVHSQEDNLSELNLNYVTSYEHAYKIAQRRMRQAVLQPREIKVNVGLEGDYYPLYSTVLLQYTTFRQGLNSSVVADLLKDSDNNIIGVRLADYVEMTSGNNYGVIIQSVTDLGRRTFYKPVRNTYNYTRDLLFVEPISETEILLPEIDNPVSFGLLTEEGSFAKVTNKMKIAGSEPNGSEGFGLTLVDYNDEIYEFGDIPVYKSNITPPPKPYKEIPMYEKLEGEKGANGKDGRSSAEYKGVFYSVLDFPDDAIEDDFMLCGQDMEMIPAIITSNYERILLNGSDLLVGHDIYKKGLLYVKNANGDWYELKDKNDYKYTICQNDSVLIGSTISPALEEATVGAFFEETGLDVLEDKKLIDETSKTINADLINGNKIFTKDLVINGGSLCSSDYKENVSGFKIDSNKISIGNGNFFGKINNTVIEAGAEGFLELSYHGLYREFPTYYGGVIMTDSFGRAYVESFITYYDELKNYIKKRYNMYLDESYVFEPYYMDGYWWIPYNYILHLDCLIGDSSEAEFSILRFKGIPNEKNISSSKIPSGVVYIDIDGYLKIK